MKRRNFIKLSTSASVIALSPLEFQAAMKSVMPTLQCPDISNRKLILINLAGGNDGLNAVIPLNQYDLYSNLRPNIKIQNSGPNAYIQLDKGLSFDKQVGLHPGLKGFKSIYDKGVLRIIQGVGYPSQNKSHFKSTDLYLTGNDGKSLDNGANSGWIGRFMEQYYADQLAEPFPLAIEMGSPKNSLGFHGIEEHGMSLNITGQDPSGYYSILNGLGGEPPENLPISDYGKELDFLINTDKLSNKYAKQISNAFNKGQNTVGYPDTNFSDQLKTVAKLISGDLQSKVFMVRIGGFDTHNAQVQGSGDILGRHNDLLTELSEGVEAFISDMTQQNLADDIVGLTFSEFGRKAKENGNLGTDHGEIAPMFVFGSAVEGGVSGTNPDLSEASGTNNFQLETVQYDYRETIGTLLQDYLGADNNVIDGTFFNHASLGSFYDAKIENLIKDQFNVSKSCLKESTLGVKEWLEWGVFPNPFKDTVNLVSLKEEEYINYELYALSGELLMRNKQRTLMESVKLDLGHLDSGTYILKVFSSKGQEVHKIIKM